jgi:hypothetical protein
MPESFRLARPRAERGQGASGIQSNYRPLTRAGRLDSRRKHAGMTSETWCVLHVA